MIAPVTLLEPGTDNGLYPFDVSRGDMDLWMEVINVNPWCLTDDLRTLGRSEWAAYLLGPNNLVWAVKDSGHWVGIIYLTRNGMHPVAALNGYGFSMYPSRAAKGFILARDWAFTQGVQHLISEPCIQNKAVARVLEWAGFQMIGVRIKFALYGGKLLGVALYDAFPDEDMTDNLTGEQINGRG